MYTKIRLKPKELLERENADFKRLTEADMQYFIHTRLFYRPPTLAFCPANPKTVNTIVKKQEGNYIKNTCLEILGKSVISKTSAAHHI